MMRCMVLIFGDIVYFMEHGKLTNRYDHFVLAGTALGAVHNEYWDRVFSEDLELLAAGE